MKRISLAGFILLLIYGVAYPWPWGGGGGGGGGAGGGTVTEVIGNAMIAVADGTTTPGLSLTDNSITSAKLLDNTIAVSKLAHTGTASSTVFFRGDGAWTSNVVIGPGTVTDDLLATFDGTTGRLLKEGPSRLNPTFNSLSAYGTNGIALGTSGTYNGKIIMKSGTGSNNFLFTILGSNFAADIGWTLPTAAPAGNDYILRSSTAGVLSYVDPSTLGSAASDTAYAGTWDGVTTIAPSKNAVYDQMELKANISRTKTFSFGFDGVAATDNVLLWRAPVAITITRADCYASVDNVVGSLMECATNNVTSCTVLDAWTITNAVSPFTDSSMTDGAVAAGAWIRWSTTSVGTTGNRLTCTVQYNE